MPTTDDFRETLEEIFSIARTLKLSGIVVRAGYLHSLVGGYSNSNHRMPICCNAMRQLMKSGDEVIYEPPSGQGASLEILYKFSY
jgi:hypothetical protein